MKQFLMQWEVIAGIITLIITPTVTFFAGKKTRNSKEKSEEATALQNMQSVYDTFTKQTNIQLESFVSDLKAVKEENIEQRKDLRELQKDNRQLHKEVNQLREENAKLRKRNDELVKINNSLQQKINLTSKG